jgi:NADH:ubiquinone oxidoreductase subunit E
MAQELRGYVSPGTMDEVAALLDLSPAYVRGVATFYTMYNKRPVGRFLIQVCTNISCSLCGGDDVLRAFLNNTGTELGETSEDGLFTVVEAECLAACGFPTTVQINSRYYENVTPKDVPEILERLKAQGE